MGAFVPRSTQASAVLLVVALAAFTVSPARSVEAIPGSLDREALVAELDAGPISADRSIAVLKDFARLGKADDLDLVVRILESAEVDVDARRQVLAAFEDAVSGILQRDPNVLSGVGDLVAGAPADTSSAVVRAIGCMEGREALVTLARLLGTDGALDVALLSSIARLAQRTERPAPLAVRRSVRRRMQDSDDQIARRAVHAVGQLEDADAIEDLLELLESDDPVLRGEAHRALQSIARLTLPDDVTRWRSWYDSESNWHREQSQELFDELCNGDSDRICEALKALAQRQLHREEISAYVATVAFHHSPVIRIQSCRVLGQLGSHTTIEVLIDSLEDRDPEVVEAAWQALRRITGHDLPSEFAPWREAFVADQLWAPPGAAER